MPDYPAKQFYGSATTVLSLAATLASGANTFNGLANNTLTDLDNSTNLYTDAVAVLEIGRAHV